MKKLLLITACVFLLCACKSNNPPDSSDEIYAPVTQAEIDAITEKFNKNRDCIKSWQGKYLGEDLHITRIREARKTDASTIAMRTGQCFNDVYAHGISEIINGQFVDESYLKQRVFLVFVPNKYGNETDLYFDMNYNLIEAPLSATDDCGCDCWKD